MTDGDPAAANGHDGNGHAKKTWPGYPAPPLGPPPPELAGKVIVGGRWDNRDRTLWKPEDGYAETALVESGRRLGRPQCCGRRNYKRGGGRCVSAPLKGHRLCKLHGGAIGAGGYSTRLAYGNSLTGGLRDALIRFSNVKDALDCIPGLAVMHATLDTVLERAAAEGDTPAFRQQAQTLYDAAAAKMREGDGPGFAETFRDLGALIRRGVAADRSLLEAFDLSERVVAKADRVLQTQIAGQRAYTELQVLGILRDLVEIVGAHAPKQLADRIIDDLERRLAAPTRAPALLGEGAG